MHNGFFRGVDRLERSASEVGREGRPICARPRPHGHALTESVILKKPLRSFFLHGGRGQRERGGETEKRFIVSAPPLAPASGIAAGANIKTQQNTTQRGSGEPKRQPLDCAIATFVFMLQVVAKRREEYKWSIN